MANNDGGGGVGVGVVVQVKHYCQVEKCEVNLDGAKKYHKRHKVCQVHAKAPIVLLAGLRQRFCQQCSRFHELSEFDGTKKSCRLRLDGHNKRRRKTPLPIELEDNHCRLINGEASPHMDMTFSSRNTIHTADISG
ncbi:hypothetical protein KY285_031512 [Solanum tuberosum]|uniref:squamosa promoter-binding-like protein 3 n=1 Tax=Solanum stenotomum TaxID=172797 RepID=UPI001E8C3792|nr:squamosa promoter-binding-like protein 3 [Solanum stenotomum]KAH0651386.1 hypothetical protein KY284_031298 [Solanum tuberosum]KAH0656630.1 hypothetical protein KY285_031512 [Solanum tuberosum]